MKTKQSAKYKISEPVTLELKEVATMPEVGLVIPLRAAKAKLSALLELVASGQRITITSAGVPKVVLTPASAEAGRKPFMGMGDFLLSQRVHGGPSSEELVREDRDSRGW
ncbi:MAG: type II toxin-antitoxin system Phd/YefM family antitoxin [Limisphaerales bacterium]